MGILKIDNNWAKELFPGGIHYPSSTVISGRGGSGKPLVELAFVAEWVKQGGKTIGIPLQYPDSKFLKESMRKLYDLDLNDYKRKSVFIQFDPDLKNIQDLSQEELAVNLLIPDMWDRMIEKSLDKMNADKEEVLIYGSALNLLLFAPAYTSSSVIKISELLKNNAGFTYLFTVSNNVMGEKIANWEEAADNLFFTLMEEKELYVCAERINQQAVQTEKYHIDIQPETLDEIKEIAEKNRKKLIPKLKKIK